MTSSFSTVPLSTQQPNWNVYLSGEIHSSWRSTIASACSAASLPVSFSSPHLHHSESDDCSQLITGSLSSDRPNWDHRSALLNSARTEHSIRNADLVVVRFGEKYRQWNAAFDAGFAAALGKSYIVMHPEGVSHMLKEVNAGAKAVVREVSGWVEEKQMRGGVCSRKF